VEYISWGRPKRVSYWAAFSAGLEAAPGQEIDAISWLPLAQARKQLADTHDDPVISVLRPFETVPLILARHASAGRKADWPGDDAMRPLDKRGEADARVLAGLLACFAPAARVISSPALRCTETVRPYAEKSGRTVEAQACLVPFGRSPDFSSRTEQDDALRHLLWGLVEQRRPAVLCLHRENLPEVLAQACAALGAAAAVPADPALPKGGFWVAHVSHNGMGHNGMGHHGMRKAGELAALERYEP
jgi:8-oxo-dGTP diphosphatase